MTDRGRGGSLFKRALPENPRYGVVWIGAGDFIARGVIVGIGNDGKWLRGATKSQSGGTEAGGGTG